jgi:hypothetical protein
MRRPRADSDRLGLRVIPANAGILGEIPACAGMTSVTAFVLLACVLGATPLAAQEADPLNDYPTVARADYVFACMATNGQTRRALEQCACSIDHIARLVPFDEYERAETTIRTLQRGGENVGAMHNSERLNAALADLHRAQAEADMLCF